MSVALKKVEGVESVQVSLNRGLAEVRLKPGNRIDPEGLRKIVRDAGFTPKGAEVSVRGKVIEQNGNYALEVSGTGEVYALVEDPQRRGTLAELVKVALGEEVTLEAYLAESKPPPAENSECTLVLRTFSSSIFPAGGDERYAAASPEKWSSVVHDFARLGLGDLPEPLTDHHWTLGEVRVTLTLEWDGFDLTVEPTRP